MTPKELFDKLLTLRADVQSIKWWALSVQEEITEEEWARLRPVLEQANDACAYVILPLSHALEAVRKIDRRH